MKLTIEPGTWVTVVDYKGARLERRVWQDTGPGVLICKEQEYQRALRTGDEALCAGFGKDSIVEMRHSE